MPSHHRPKSTRVIGEPHGSTMRLGHGHANLIIAPAISAWLIFIRCFIFSSSLHVQYTALRDAATRAQGGMVIVALVNGQTVRLRGLVAQLKLDGQVLQHEATEPRQASELHFRLSSMLSGQIELKVAGLDERNCIVASGAGGVNRQSINSDSVIELHIDLKNLQSPICD